jgi:hypothetical protein
MSPKVTDDAASEVTLVDTPEGSNARSQSSTSDYLPTRPCVTECACLSLPLVGTADRTSGLRGLLSGTRGIQSSQSGAAPSTKAKTKADPNKNWEARIRKTFLKILHCTPIHGRTNFSRCLVPEGW